MDKQQLEQFLANKQEVSVPEIQQKFNLSYKEARLSVEELVKSKILSETEGIGYKIDESKLTPFEKTSEIDLQRCAEELEMDVSEAKKFLQWCATEKAVSYSSIVRKFRVSYLRACRRLEWLQKNHFVEEESSGAMNYRVTITPEQKRLLDVVDDIDPIIAKGTIFYDNFFDMDDDETDFETESRDDDETDFNAVYQMAKQVEQEKNRKVMEDAIPKMPNYNKQDGTFSFAMSVNYPDGTPLKMKFLEVDGSWYISDCGGTYKFLASKQETAQVAEQMKYLFGYEDVLIENGEVRCTVDRFDNLSVETANLLQEIDGMLSTDCSKKMLTAEEIAIVDNLIKLPNAFTMARILEVCSENNGSVSRKNLIFGVHCDATQRKTCLDKLTELGLVVVQQSLSVSLTEKVSANLIGAIIRLVESE